MYQHHIKVYEPRRDCCTSTSAIASQTIQSSGMGLNQIFFNEKQCFGIQDLNIWCTVLLRRANPMLLMFIVLQRKCNWDPSASLVALILSNHRPRTTSAASPTPCEPITPFLSPCSLISLLSRLQKGGFLLIFMRDRNVVLQIMTNIQKQQQRLRGRPNVSRSVLWENRSGTYPG